MKVVLSVDWEVNCDQWLSGEETAYWGVSAGTPSLESLLDEFGIPCTWLIECNARYQWRDLPLQHPDLVKSILSRKRDEVGAHVHMGDHLPSEDRWIYPGALRAQEVSSHLDHASKNLISLGSIPRSFRSGAFYHPNGLPSLLLRSGFRNDSSRYFDWWVRPPAPPRRDIFKLNGPVRLVKQLYRRTMLRRTIPPYECSAESIMRKGKSGVAELPCSMHIMYLLQDENLLARFWDKLPDHRDGVLTLYFHIFELTRPPKSSREPLRDSGVYRHFERLLDTLHSFDGVEFCTFDEVGQDVISRRD